MVEEQRALQRLAKLGVTFRASLVPSPLPAAILYMARKVVWETEPTFLAQ